MIKELAQFVNSLAPEFKTFGLKAKEGLHVLLRIQSDGETNYMSEESLVVSVYTKTKNLDGDELVMLGKFASLSQLSWCVNTNKCFDLPTKAIHSCSPYCLAVKRENLVNGQKYISNASEGKSQVYERINNYFAKGFDLIEDESEKQRLEIFKYAINNEEKMHGWLERIPSFSEMKDSEYVIFYLDEPVEKYEKANSKYLNDKLFNTPEYTVPFQDEYFGTSDFFNGFSTKKAFLKHQSASFDISGRISAQDARSLYEFQDIIGRNILPRPLPIFINHEELQKESIALFKENAEEGGKIGYKEIIERLHENHKSDLGNYYLLFYQMGEIKDFDFVSKFEYDLADAEGRPWRVEDLFNCKYNPTVANVFDFQYLILVPIFNNALIVKTKTGSFQHKYFDEIDSAYCKSDVTFLQVMKYRRAFYDFIFKSRRQSVTKLMFDDILQTSIIEDMRLDEFKNDSHSQYLSIHQKLNIWFSLSEKFNDFNKKHNMSMINQIKTLRSDMKDISEGNADIETNEQFGYATGQVFYYLYTLSRSGDQSYGRLEALLQKTSIEDVKELLKSMIKTYKHELYDYNDRFNTVVGQIFLCIPTVSIKEIMPCLLGGFFSKNIFYTKKTSDNL